MAKVAGPKKESRVPVWIYFLLALSPFVGLCDITNSQIPLADGASSVCPTFHRGLLC